MTDSFFNQLSKQASQTFEQASKLQQTMLNNLGKMSEFHMERLKNYTDMAASQAKELGAVRDLESLKGFVASQAEFMSSVSKKLMDDWKELGEMTSTLRQDVEQTFNPKSASEAAPGATEVAPVAAEATPVDVAPETAKASESKPRQKNEAKSGSEA